MYIFNGEFIIIFFFNVLNLEKKTTIKSVLWVCVWLGWMYQGRVGTFPLTRGNMIGVYLALQLWVMTHAEAWTESRFVVELLLMFHLILFHSRWMLHTVKGFRFKRHKRRKTPPGTTTEREEWEELPKPPLYAAFVGDGISWDQIFHLNL